MEMEEFDWNAQNECYLLESMSGHKPIGVNKAFQMLCIYDKFKERIEKEVLSKAIWTHLGTMYNLEALDDNELLPFPNQEVDFELPDTEFADLKESKLSQKNEEPKAEEPITTLTIKDILKQEDKLVVNIINDTQRRDSKDSRSSSTSSKKDKEVVPKKENEKSTKPNKSKLSKGDTPKLNKTKDGETSTKPAKRPTRGSLKADDSSSSGKSSPIMVTPTPGKKRRAK